MLVTYTNNIYLMRLSSSYEIYVNSGFLSANES